MATPYRCARGHLWEDLLDAPSLVDGQVRCPVCGSASQPCPASAKEGGQTALLSPVRDASAALVNSGPTRQLACIPATDPMLEEEGDDTPPPPSAAGLATALKPAMRNAPARAESLAIEVTTPPRGPSGFPERTSEVEVAPFLPPPAAPAPRSEAVPPARSAGRGTASESRPTTPETPSAKAKPDIPGYEILGELGRGGMGVVYKARQVGLNRLVALKMILAGSAADDRDRARFKTEAEAIARLQHPNIVQIFEVGDHAGSGWFSLEFVDGGSLADRLKGEALPVHESARLIETLARAVHFAHLHGVVHRDLKPANVLLQKEGQAESSSEVESARKKHPAPSISSSAVAAVTQLTPKITDFGLAKTLDTDIHHTRSGMVVGTPGYMAPEQATGGEGVGPATDTYALGVILYQLVTGKLPFVGESPMEVMLKVTQEEPPRPRKWQPRLAADLETIILKCLEKDPKRRYASSLDLAEDLRRFLAHESILARPVQPWERGVRWVRRRPAVAAMLALSVLAVAGSLGTLAWYERGEKARRAQERKEVEVALTKARDLVGPGTSPTLATWEGVRTAMEESAKRVRKDGALADLAGEVEGLLAEAHGHLNAGKTYAAFTKARDEALFQATLASGNASPGHLEATRAKVEGALATVGASASRLPEPEGTFSQEQTEEIKRGCYELLLVLADTTAQTQTNESAEAKRAKARAALAILATADRFKIETRAYHLRKARFLDAAGSVNRAAKERAAAENRPLQEAMDFYLVGTERYRQGDVRHAEAAFEKALNKNDGHFWARFYLALCQVREGQLIAARDNLSSCLAQQRKEKQQPELRIYLLRGFAQGQLRQFDEALDDFAVAEQALTAPPKEERDVEMLYALYNNRAVTRLGKGQFAGARADLKAATDLVPDQYQAYVTLSQVYRQESQAARKKGDAKLAAKQLETGRKELDLGLRKAEALHEKKMLDAVTLHQLRRLRYALNVEGKDPKAALDDLNWMIDLGGGSQAARARALRDRGHLFYTKEKFAEALAEYDAALKLQPGDTDLERWRGEVLLRVEPPRYQDAIAAFTRYLAGRKAPGPGELNVYRGRAFARMKLKPPQLPEAILDFTQALDLKIPDPAQRSELHLQRGQAYLGSESWALAVKDFDAVLNSPLPAHARAAHQGRAVARLQQGDRKKAVEDAVKDAEAIVKLAQQPGAKDAAEGLYAAACLFAQVAGQVDLSRDKEVSSRLGMIRGGARWERKRYLDRAAGLLQQALDAMPEESRADFWQSKVKKDKESALEPLKSHEAFLRLERRFSLN
jgi:serine/threonine protein kinase/tetratricopeptide (TPR) repeat protein